ncbi:MAG: hypothetical protein K2N16_09720 [Muribaculaceae bacterium]|nr:hypothetical protein [Muribaculaceae bacterium]
MKSIAVCILATCLAILASCSGTEQRTAPRPQGHPRVQAYDTAYSAVPGLPVHFEANSQAQTEVETKDGGAVWLTLSYPAYDARLMCTLTPVTDTTVGSVVDNRSERMALNVIGTEPQVDKLSNPAGYSAIIICDPVAVATPVQFLAAPDNIDGRGWVVSGTAFFDHAQAGAPIDSLAPMVETLLRDVRHSISTLK